MAEINCPLIEILKRFAKGKRVEEDEAFIVEKYSVTGITHIGFSFKK